MQCYTQQGSPLSHPNGYFLRHATHARLAAALHKGFQGVTAAPPGRVKGIFVNRTVLYSFP